VSRAGLALLLVGLAATTLDLAHKAWATGGAVPVHERSTLWITAFAALAAIEAAAIVLTRSTALALAGGLLVGGCAANLASPAIWGGVPDAIALGGVYLSLADLLIAAGIVALLPAAALLARRELAANRSATST
jgi:lipoprotein signal peptidase